MSEFILVEFDENREVLIDGNPSGNNTGDVIPVEAGTHTISLSDPRNYTPQSKDVTVSGTSQFNPLKIKFTRRT